MIVLSKSFVLSQAAAGNVDPDLPAVGWHNLVTPVTILASAAADNYPASNLANPATHLEWRGTSTAEHRLFVTTNYVDEIDYVAIARHNLGSAQIAVSVERLTDGGGYVEIVEPRVLVDDGPVILRFTPQSIEQLRIRLFTGSAPPRAAVLYAGKLLDMERKIYVGHTPLPHGRRTNVANGMSESGNFLGRIVLGRWRETTVPLSLISPGWFREKLEPFLRVADERPFFFAWRPNSYPLEVGYAWFTGDVKPAPVGPSNLIAFDWSLSGIA